MKLSRYEILLLIIITISIIISLNTKPNNVEGMSNCVDLLIVKIGCEPTKAVNTVRDITNQVTNIDNSIKQNIDQSCGGSLSGGNQVIINNSIIDNLGINQKNVFKNVCALQSAFKSNIDVKTQDKIASAIAQNASSKGGVFAGTGSSDNNIFSESNTSTNIDNSKVLNSVKRCVNNLKTGNLVDINNSTVTNTNIDQTNDAFIQCLLDDKDTADIAIEAKKENAKTVDQTAKAEGGNLVESFFNGISGLFGIGPKIVIAISVILLIFCIVSSGLSAYMGMSSSAPAQTGRENMSKAFSQLQQLQQLQSGTTPNIGNTLSQLKMPTSLPPQYSNFDWIGSAKNLIKNIP